MTVDQFRINPLRVCLQFGGHGVNSVLSVRSTKMVASNTLGYLKITELD